MESFFASAVGAALGAGVVTTMLGALLVHRFTRARDADSRESALREKRREESRAVAEILSEWVRCRYTGKFTNEDRWKLQTVYWKNILGLDQNLIKVLLPRLANDPNARTVDELIIEARRILLGLDKADIPSNGLNHWAPNKEEFDK